jgi:translation initiation factor IF-2
MAFHLGGDAGPALAAAPRMSAPTSSPAPPVGATAALASTTLASPDAGGCGWGIREQRPSMYPTGAPIPAAAGSTGGPSAGGPSAGGADAGAGAYPGYGYPVQPVVSAPRVGRSRSAFYALVLVIFVALVAAGAFLYLRS